MDSLKEIILASLSARSDRKAAPKRSSSVETKNMKSYRLLYEAFKQAQRHTNMEPLLVLKGHREKPVVIIDMEHFFNILEVD